MTGGVNPSSVPPTLKNFLNSQACHGMHSSQVSTVTAHAQSLVTLTFFFSTSFLAGAIKFGDKLTGEDCKTLIAALANCQFPFQCAHGRSGEECERGRETRCVICKSLFFSLQAVCDSHFGHDAIRPEVPPSVSSYQPKQTQSQVTSYTPCPAEPAMCFF